MTRLQRTKDFWITSLRAEGTAFRAAAAAADPAAPVPSCPGWRVTDLVQHLGSIYRWALNLLNAQTTERPPRPRTLDGLPEGPAALHWWQQEFDKLLDLLDQIDPESPAWNWAPQPKQAGFWPRRMAHETAIHRWDAQLAAGGGLPIEAKLATDGINEVLDSWLPAGRRRPAPPRHCVVQLVAVDAGQEWLLRLRGEGVALLDANTLLDSSSHRPRVRAAGTASDLLLALWGRVGFDTIDVAGDATLPESLHPG